MKKLLLVAVAGGTGYLLGARAGRPAYDRVATAVDRLSRSTGLDTAAGTVLTAGADLRDAATHRAADKVKDLSGSAATQLADVVDAARAHVEPQVEPHAGPLVETYVAQG